MRPRGRTRQTPIASSTMRVTDQRTPPAVAPFALGATIFAGALATGPLTDGSLNPARSLGPAIVA